MKRAMRAALEISVEGFTACALGMMTCRLRNAQVPLDGAATCRFAAPPGSVAVARYFHLRADLLLRNHQEAHPEEACKQSFGRLLRLFDVHEGMRAKRTH